MAEPKLAQKTFTTIDSKTHKKKLKDEENRFKLEMMGHEDERKSVKFINENNEEILFEEAEIEYRGKEELKKSRRGTKFNYYVKLAQHSTEMIAKYSDLPKYFKWGVYPTSKGVVFWLRTFDEKPFVKAIKPIGDPHIDLIGGVYTCIRELENTAIRERDKLNIVPVEDDSGLKKTKSGIILP
ncbi:MAG: hypothetical protein [Podoviridae sp. ctg2L5]|nr:MAG: hypothetical protein [Podoviridae sp. ctg2L5]